MCNVSEGIVERSYNKGMAQGIIGDVRNLMDSMKWSAEQAMAALKIPENERGTYEEMLKKYQ